MKFNRVLTKNQ